MAWYWFVLACMSSGSFGFVMCAIFVAGARSDIYYYSSQEADEKQCMMK